MMSESKSNSERIEMLENRIEALEEELEKVRKQANTHTPPMRIGGH